MPVSKDKREKLVSDPAVFAWVDPINDPRLIAYFDQISRWHGYVRLLGLPHLYDEPDIPLDRLFVEPFVSTTYISTDTPVKQWPKRELVTTALQQNPLMILLGDPGTGKSTLVSWISWLLAAPMTNRWQKILGRRVPLPFVLREIKICTNMSGWDDLLICFLAHPVAKDLAQESDLLHQLLVSGQAIILLDGLDEVSMDSREALKHAIREGMLRYPAVHWVITSRIVGFDDRSFITDKLISPKQKELLDNKSIASSTTIGTHEWRDKHSIRYLVPFDDTQIEQFSYNWYTTREADRDHAINRANDLITAISKHEGTRRLARIPNLLTLIAIIHRNRADLPDGRIRLYEDIATAYLHSIDTFRGIETLPYPLETKQEWLGRIGFEMQKRRTDEDDSSSLMANDQEILNWLVTEISTTDSSDSGEIACRFLDYVGRRSGLLLPRAEGKYAFVHLSFQEYFAARHLARAISRREFLKGSTAFNISRNDLQTFAASSCWRETFLLLFELLEHRHRDDLIDEVTELIFAKPFSHPQSTIKFAMERNRVSLLSILSVDTASGLPERNIAWKRCLAWIISGQQNTEWFYRRELRTLLSLLLGREHTYIKQILAVLEQYLKIETNIETLSLNGCAGLTDLKQISFLTELKHIDLAYCTEISDLKPLTGLKQLIVLSVEGCQKITDLTPLTDLTRLLFLDLTGCLKVMDISPLAKLTKLTYLYLEGCYQINDLTPITGLIAIKTLDMSHCKKITDINPLSGLIHIENLDLTNCIGINDINPLSGLIHIENLDLINCIGINDLSPIANLTELKRLSLIGCKGITDLTPLEKLEKVIIHISNRSLLKELSPKMKKRIKG